MAKFDYDKARLTAEKLIDKFGAGGSFIKHNNDGGYDGDGNAIPAEPDITVNGTVTPLLEYDTQTMKGASEAQGTTIQSGDKYCFFHSDTAPEIGSVITINGETWRLVSIVDLTSVGGVNLYRKMQLRR